MTPAALAKMARERFPEAKSAEWHREAFSDNYLMTVTLHDGRQAKYRINGQELASARTIDAVMGKIFTQTTEGDRRPVVAVRAVLRCGEAEAEPLQGLFVSGEAQRPLHPNAGQQVAVNLELPAPLVAV